MKKEIRFSNFSDLTQKSELNGKNETDKLNLLRLNEYRGILNVVRDINNNIYILIHVPENNILIPCPSTSEFNQITKTLILNYEYYKRYEKDKIGSNSKQKVKIFIEKDYISPNLNAVKQIINEIISKYTIHYKRVLWFAIKNCFIS